MDKDQILRLIRSNRELIEGKGVISLALFGSYSEDRQRPDSDIDILVKFRESDKSYDNFIELAFFLEKLLGRKVELVTPESLSGAFLNEISKKALYAY
jgi:predicted nucleotidyltransferase